MTDNKERILDLCCGAGAGAVGFETHFEISEAVDHNPDAAASYAANHKATTVHCRDVLDYWAGRKDFDGVHGVLATPPCQGFSKLNKHARAKHGDTRNALTGRISELVASINPEFVILENVPQITREVREIAETAFKSRSYNVVQLHMNAAEFGSAQRRTRWILVATRQGRKIAPMMPSAPRTVRQAFQGLPPDFRAKRRTCERLQTIFRPVRDPVWQRVRSKTFADTCRLAWDQPAPAVVNIYKTYMLHPDEDRPIEQEEALTLFGVPGNYVLRGVALSRGQQIANMMTSEMADAIGRSITQRL